MNNTKWTIVGIAAGGLIILIWLFGYPIYNVYSSRKEGQAELAKAQYNREVQVAEARAKMEAAALLAQADSIRAHGIAASNKIIGQSLENNPSYLVWKWIDELKETQNQIIYVPGGSLGMPIMEANRLAKPLNSTQQ